MNTGMLFAGFTALATGCLLRAGQNSLLPVFFLVAAALILLWRIRGTPDLTPVVFLLVVCMGWGYAGFTEARMEALAREAMEEEVLILEVRTAPRETARGYQGDFRGTGRFRSLRVRLQTPEPLEPDTRVRLDGALLMIPDPARGLGQADWRNILRGEGIWLQGFVSRNQYQTLPAVRRSLSGAVLVARSRFATKLKMEIPREAPVVLAAVFGDKSGLDDEFLDSTSLLGIRHLFAVSGMHAGAFALLLVLLCAGFGITGRGRLAVTGAGMAGFCLLSGMTPSVIRAGLMLLIHQYCEYHRIEKSMGAALGISGLIMLLVNPFYVLSAGFLLSYSAVSGLAFVYPLLKRRLPLPEPLLAGFSAWVMGLPFQEVFGRSSPAGMVLSVLFAPVLLVLVPAGVVLFLLAEVPVLFPVLARGIALPARLITWPVEMAGQHGTGILNAIMLPLPVTDPARKMLFFGIWTLVLGLDRKAEQMRPKGRYGGGFLAVLCLLQVLFIAVPVHPRGVLVAFLDVGQGDCVAVVHRGRVMLVDAGTMGAGERAVLPWLRAMGLRKVDLMVVSHNHEDHVGGLIPVLRQMPVDSVLVASGSGPPQDMEGEAMKVLALHRGRQFVWNGLKFRAVSPERGFSGEPNENSLALYMESGGMELLLTGDLEGPQLKNLGQIPEAGVTGPMILKAPHHGSRYSLDPAVLDRIRPDLVVISAGPGNRYGHPHPEVLDYWQDRGVPVLRTDRQGEIRVRGFRGKLKVSTWLEPAV